MAAAESCLDRPGLLDAFDQHVDAVAAPKQLAVEHHGRHAEHAEHFGLVDDAVMLGACGAMDVGFELAGRATAGRDDVRDCGEIVDLELMAPEPTKHRVVIRTEEAVLLGEQHADAGIERVVDPPGPFHDEPPRIGIAPSVHIGVAHLAPEMRRALFHGPHEFGNAQRIGQPFELDAVRLLEFEQALVGHECVGALVIGVDTHAGAWHWQIPFIRAALPARRGAGAQIGRKKKTIAPGPSDGRSFPFGRQKSQSLPLLFGAETTTFPSEIDGLTAMERTRFEPFGEQLVSATDTQPRSRGSKLLLRVGTGLFWSLVAGIVLARAAFFEPGVYDGFSRVASLAKSLIF